MNRYNINYIGNVKKEIFDILDYISYDLCNPTASSELSNSIFSAIDRLAEFPYIYPVLEQKHKKSSAYRKMIVKNYLVIYFIDETTRTVFIEHVVYARRNLKAIL